MSPGFEAAAVAVSLPCSGVAIDAHASRHRAYLDPLFPG
jgi:hypothetical protein